jgi:hypothetical protein
MGKWKASCLLQQQVECSARHTQRPPDTTRKHRWHAYPGQQAHAWNPCRQALQRKESGEIDDSGIADDVLLYGEKTRESAPGRSQSEEEAQANLKKQERRRQDRPVEASKREHPNSNLVRSSAENIGKVMLTRTCS